MVECARLESVCALTGTQGSNPCPSASVIINDLRNGEAQSNGKDNGSRYCRLGHQATESTKFERPWERISEVVPPHIELQSTFFSPYPGKFVSFQ